MDPAKLQIVIALFEREYPEERIKKAIRHCNSVDSAIEWLERETGAPAPRTPVLNSASVPPRAAKENRRRMNRKSAEALEQMQKPTTTRPVLEEQGQVPRSDSKAPTDAPPSDSKASSRASPTTSDGASDNQPQAQSQSPAVALEEASMAMVSGELLPPQTLASVSPNLAQCDSGAVDAVLSNAAATEVPLIQICPMEPDAAAEWWAKARAKWPQIREGLLDRKLGERKRSASSDAGDTALTPRKKPRTGIESPSRTPNARPPATPQGNVSGGSASAPGNAIVEEAAGSSEEASATKVSSPLSAGHPRVGQFASRSLRSPMPSGKVSNRRGSWTPGTSPRAQMNHNPGGETCEICCNDVEKGQAVRLGCRHGWYCMDCMKRHAEARLEVGDAHVACPECSTPIAECNLRKILSAELIERLLARSLEHAVSSTSDLWACPTPNCPMRVALEEGEEPRLQCTACNKESCLRCGTQPYHKGLTCEEHAERIKERKSRKKAEAAEATFRQWMQETGTKQCPTCGMAVTKQHLNSQATQYQECHKMLCRNCSTRFCFKCCAILTDTFTCGCSNDRHGFCDPKTGKRLDHLRPAGTKGRPKKAGR